MYGAEKLSKSYVLSRISEEDIMRFYLGIPVQFSKQVPSPLRRDVNPTCGFAIDQRGFLKFKDFAGHFHGDCFSVVQHIYSCDFIAALEIIAQDFALRTACVVPELALRSNTVLPRQAKSISVKRQRWREVDRLFWSGFGITSKTLNAYHVASISHAWVEDRIVYTYKDTDPGYVYWLGEGKCKLYFPLRSTFRFLGNCPELLQGYAQLPPTGELLLLTKSLKDVMLLWQYNIPAVAPASETSLVPEAQINELRSRFTHLYSLYDFDYAGITGAQKLKRKYRIPALFLTNGRFGSVDYHAKDLSDFYKHHGKELTDEFIHFNLTVFTTHERPT